MKALALLLTTCALATALSGCTDDSPAPSTSSSGPAATDSCASETKTGLTLTNQNSTVVALNTARGCIVVELHDDKAPLTVANFKKLVQEGFYKDVLFHRIIKTFMVQTGGMQTDGEFKESPYPPIKNEAKTSGLKNLKYTLSMARTTAPDSATNQFFINTADNCNLDPQTNSACPDRSGPDGYAVFGKVVKGQAIVDNIAATPTTVYNAPGANPHCQAEPNTASCPKTDVVLRSIKLL